MMFRVRSKMFSPLNVGAFELRHRLVIDWEDPRAHPLAAFGPDETMPDPWLLGGLTIHAPASLLWPERSAGRSLLDVVDESAWPLLIQRAKGSMQSLVARLSTEVRSYRPELPEDINLLGQDQIEQIVEHYVGAAKRAKQSGFDGVELDATAGSVSDLFLASETNRRSDRYGGAIGRRMSFLLDLVAALAAVIGRERVGVRLSPFTCYVGEKARTEDFSETLVALNDLEIAYIHLFDGKPTHRAVGTWCLSAAAETLRRAHSGILISSRRDNLVDTVGLVESRWADAICFPAGELDPETCEQLRRIWPEDARS